MVGGDYACYKKSRISHCCATFLTINNENIDSHYQILQETV